MMKQYSAFMRQADTQAVTKAKRLEHLSEEPYCGRNDGSIYRNRGSWYAGTLRERVLDYDLDIDSSVRIG